MMMGRQGVTKSDSCDDKASSQVFSLGALGDIQTIKLSGLGPSSGSYQSLQALKAVTTPGRSPHP